MIFHYPYYAGVPISAIRMGDYKFMRQLDTGETRLHNVATDMGEKNNLIKKMPEKAQEMDRVLQEYLKEVGAWKIDDVYAARFRELEGYKKMRKEKSGPEIDRLNKQIKDTKRNQAVTKWL